MRMARFGPRNSWRPPGGFWISRCPKACRGESMLKSVQLSLMIGPVVPLTASRSVLDALTEVEVNIVDVGTSGFKLTFTIDKQSPLNILFLLSGGMPLLFMRV